MMRTRSRSSDIEEPSEEAIMETEVARLQRSYRVMQNDYKAYKEMTRVAINKQRLLIHGLEKESTELNTTMGKMETNQNKAKDEKNAKQLSELSSIEKEYQDLIKKEREDQKEMDNQILDLEKEIGAQRQGMGGVHNSTAKHIAIHKRRAVLENRLDKAVVHFNNQLAINRQLRDDIDHLRRERTVFENLYKRLAKELEMSKKEMSEVIESSTQAFEQRDEALSKMNALKERNEKDQSLHDVEMKDLMRTISHDNKVKEFMAIKASDRMEYKVEEAAKRKKGDEKGMDADQALIQSYEDAFKRIQDVTGEKDLEVIVGNFIRNEDSNFALFNYVNELNAHVESLHEEVANLLTDMDKFKEEDIKVDDNRKLMMRQLEIKYEGSAKETQKSDNLLKNVNKDLDQLRSSVEGLFARIGCDPRPIRDMLGGDVGVTNKNIMTYMGLIENRTTDLLNMLHFIKLKASQIEGITPPKDPVIVNPPLHPQVQIMPPSTGDDELDLGLDMDDSELRPFSEEELRSRITRGLERKFLAQLNEIRPQKSSSGNRSKRSGARSKTAESS